MSEDRLKWQHRCAAAIAVEELLLKNDMPTEFAASIRSQIENKAGSMLPPVTGQLSAELSGAILGVVNGTRMN